MTCVLRRSSLDKGICFEIPTRSYLFLQSRILVRFSFGPQFPNISVKMTESWQYPWKVWASCRVCFSFFFLTVEMLRASWLKKWWKKTGNEECRDWVKSRWRLSRSGGGCGVGRRDASERGSEKMRGVWEWKKTERWEMNANWELNVSILIHTK